MTFSTLRINPITGAVASRPWEESLTVAEFAFLPGVYGVQTQDGIVQGSLLVSEDTTGGSEFTQVTTTPLVGQVASIYTSGFNARGLLIFNSADNGTAVSVSYDGYGTTTSYENIQASIDAAVAGSSAVATNTADISTINTELDDKDAVFAIDTITGQLQNVFNTTLGTGYNDTLADGWLCRAWCDFNGTGTPAISAAGNVSSITDNTTGDYAINFAVNMPDTNYVPVITAGNNDANNNYFAGLDNNVRSVSAFDFQVFAAPSTATDVQNISVAVFR